MIERPLRASFAALALLAPGASLALLAPRVAWAQGPGAKATPLAQAQAEVDAAWRALDGGAEADCANLCRALSSLARATERLCNLTRGEDEPTERRCSDARTKLREATQRVRSSCPECALAGQTPPSVSVEVGKPPEEPRAEEPKPAPPPPPASPSAPVSLSFESSAEDVLATARGTSITAGLGVLRLALPPAFVKAYAEVAPFPRASLLVSFGLGRLPLAAGGRATVVAGELQPRFYALGGARRGGAFAGASIAYASPTSGAGERGAREIDTPLLTTGLSVGPVIGGKVVLRPGLTLDLHGGAGVLVGDRVGDRKLVPLGDVSFGWTF